MGFLHNPFIIPLAAFVVKSLPLDAVRWLVILVVLYAAILMLRSAFGDARTALRSPAQDE